VNGSEKFLPLLDSIRLLLRHYPVQADIASVRVTAESGSRQVVVVQLAAGELGTVAAGVAEWHRTLAAGRCVAARSSDGATVDLGVCGHIDEDGTDVEVWGSTPHDARHIGSDLMPGETAAVPFEVLAVWAIGAGRVTP
jgi:hypothetical protein